MISGDEITEALERSERMLKRHLNRDKNLQDNTSTPKLESLLKRTRIFKSTKLITFRKSDWLSINERQKFWIFVNLLTKAKILTKSIAECDRIDDFDRDFFKPFKVHIEVDRITQKVSSKTTTRKYEAVLKKIKTELTDSVQSVETEINETINSIINDHRSLRELSDLTGNTIERCIMASLLDESTTDRESRGHDRLMLRARSRRESVWPIRDLIRKFSNVFSEQEILAALSPNSILFQKDYIRVDLSALDSATWLDVPVYANPELNLSASSQLITDPDLYKTEKVEEPDVSLQELIISEKERTYIAGLINLYKNGNAKALSFLFYGPAGTGKTSLAKAIAKELGKKLVTISSTDLREADFAYALSFLLTKYRTSEFFLLFDECESLWYNKHSFFLDSKQISSENAVSKVILEKSGVTMAFTSNVKPPEAFQRRVDYCLELRSPCAKIREQLLNSELTKNSEEFNIDVQISEENIRAVASSHAVPAGFYKQAIKMASSLGNGIVNTKNISIALHDISKSISSNKDSDVLPKVSMSQLVLSEEQLQTMCCISNYYENVILKGVSDPLMPQSVSVLFRGPSGTGKTIFAEALAHKLGIGFRRCCPSSFLSKWVGESEQRIKEAFADAEARGYLLFIDEIEGLLRDRAAATTSWQLTQVDEFLTQMEQFKGIIVGATNHPELLDPAFARRFLFKIDFKVPGWEQRLEFLSKHVINISSEDLSLLAKTYDLSLGLIRNAVTRFKASGCLGGVLTLNGLLEEEQIGGLGDISKKVGI